MLMCRLTIFFAFPPSFHNMCLGVFQCFVIIRRLSHEVFLVLEVNINVCLCVLVGAVRAGHLSLFPDGVLSGGGVVLLQLPKNLSLDHQHLQTGPILLF